MLEDIVAGVSNSDLDLVCLRKKWLWELWRRRSNFFKQEKASLTSSLKRKNLVVNVNIFWRSYRKKTKNQKAQGLWGRVVIHSIYMNGNGNVLAALSNGSVRNLVRRVSTFKLISSSRPLSRKNSIATGQDNNRSISINGNNDSSILRGWMIKTTAATTMMVTKAKKKNTSNHNDSSTLKKLLIISPIKWKIHTY